MTITTASPWLLDGAENPLAPASVIEELREINPRLGLNYHVALRCFMVTLKWNEDDPRYAMIQRGEIGEGADFEILCPVPTDVRLDELRGWLAGQLRRVGQGREDVRRMVAEEEARLAKANDALAEEKSDAALVELTEAVTQKNINVGRRRTKVT